MSYKKKLGLSLRKWRESLNLTQNRISDMANISQTSVTNIEQGESTNLDLILAYIKAVNYPLDVYKDLGIDINKQSNSIVKFYNDPLRYSKLIKKLIETGYFSSPRSVGEIRSKLISDYSLSELVTSGNISNVLKHLVQANNLKVDTKGKKHLYFK